MAKQLTFASRVSGVNRAKALCEVLYNFAGLRELCRFHALTMMLSTTSLNVSPNTVGYFECK